MRRIVLLLMVFVSVGLVSCLPQVQTTPTLAPTATVKAQGVPTVILNVPTEASVLPDSGCTVVIREPEPAPTAESVFPPVSDTDWVKGPASAKVTIIEYSDFQ